VTARPYRPICDVRGNLLALLDESGDIAESYRYDGFGRMRVFDGTGAELTASVLGNPFGFACKRYDPTTALCHFGARWYDPALGRFISPDPLGFVDGPNPYAYCAGDPVNFVDPWGLDGNPILPVSRYQDYLQWQRDRVAENARWYEWKPTNWAAQDRQNLEWVYGQFEARELVHGSGAVCTYPTCYQWFPD